MCRYSRSCGTRTCRYITKHIERLNIYLQYMSEVPGFRCKIVPAGTPNRLASSGFIRYPAKLTNLKNVLQKRTFFQKKRLILPQNAFVKTPFMLFFVSGFDELNFVLVSPGLPSGSRARLDRISVEPIRTAKKTSSATSTHKDAKIRQKWRGSHNN